MNSSNLFNNRSFICIVEDHYNPLNVIRSLGEQGINPIVILIAEHPYMINHCRYVKKLHTVKTVDEGYEILINQYGNEVEKPFIFCCDDNTTCFLDQHYDEMIDKFIFYNAGERGRITWLQNKDNITDLGIQAHLNCPKKEIVDTGVLPTTLKYPIITKVLASTMGANSAFGKNFRCILDVPSIGSFVCKQLRNSLDAIFGNIFFFYCLVSFAG